MKSFREWVGLGDPLLKQADTLVLAAETYATGTFTSLLKNLAFLRTVDKGHWAFILTIAGVFIAVTRLGHLGLGENHQRKLMGTVGETLAQCDTANDTRGFEYCVSCY